MLVNNDKIPTKYVVVHLSSSAAYLFEGNPYDFGLKSMFIVGMVALVEENPDSCYHQDACCSTTTKLLLTGLKPEKENRTGLKPEKVFRVVFF